MKYAEGKGAIHLKLNVLGRIGWPDRIILYYGRLLFIEFKREGEVPRKIQRWIHDQIRKHGHNVAVVDNVRDGCVLIDQFTQGGPNL